MVTGAMARSRWIAVAVLGATFLAGATIGAASSRLLAGEQPTSPTPAPQGQRERRPRTSIFDQIGLSAGQKAAVDSIMEKRRRDMDAFWKQHNPEVRAIVDSTRAEIDRLLTPEQRQKFQEFRQRRERERRDWEHQGGPRTPDGSMLPIPGHNGPADSGLSGNGGRRTPTSRNEPQLL